MLKSPITPVVLCGGSGSRLWPLSRAEFPKQFLILSGSKTLFQQTLLRLDCLRSLSTKCNPVLIVTNEEHRFLALDQIRELDSLEFKLLLEPVSKNTAPALTFAALEATKNLDDPILVIFPADHTIKNEKALEASLKDAINVANSGGVAILGIKPNRPDTGFGYIRRSEKKGKFNEFEVLEFKEKPSLEQAESYISKSFYLWNAGIFVVKANTWLEILRKFNHDTFELTLAAYKQNIQEENYLRVNKDLFDSIPSISIDIAVIEKLPKSDYQIKVIELDLGWNDLGSWSAVWESGNKDTNGNVCYGDTEVSNTYNSLIYASSRLLVTSNIKDLVIIETSDSVLVLDRKNTQNVKFIVEMLKMKKRTERNFHRKQFRPWGWFDILDEGPMFKIKRIHVKAGQSLSLQKHQHRAEHWVVIKGEAKITCGSSEIFLTENQSTYIPKNKFHQLSNPFSSPLEVVEVQSGDYLGEDDIFRISDKYNREKIQ
jgi:mannose-1-phosphate guanylyltransferase/mannose-6-phosphate isomerase